MSLIATSDFLTSIGFLSVKNSEGFIERLTFSFGNFNLDAVEGMNRHLADIWYFCGINQTAFTLDFVEFELPTTLDSIDQGLAFMAHGLRPRFQAKKMPAWYHQGVLLKHLLPWERERAAYQQRPLAVVEYEYLKLLIGKIRARALVATDDEITTVSFDGTILKIDCSGEIMVAMGLGDSWDEPVSVRTKALKELPQRIRKSGGVVCIWQEKLDIDGVAFPLIKY